MPCHDLLKNAIESVHRFWKLLSVQLNRPQASFQEHIPLFHNSFYDCICLTKELDGKKYSILIAVVVTCLINFIIWDFFIQVNVAPNHFTTYNRKMSKVMGGIQIGLAVLILALNTGMSLVWSWDRAWVIGTGWWAAPFVSFFDMYIIYTFCTFFFQLCWYKCQNEIIPAFWIIFNYITWPNDLTDLSIVWLQMIIAGSFGIAAGTNPTKCMVRETASTCCDCNSFFGIKNEHPTINFEEV